MYQILFDWKFAWIRKAGKLIEVEDDEEDGEIEGKRREFELEEVELYEMEFGKLRSELAIELLIEWGNDGTEFVILLLLLLLL